MHKSQTHYAVLGVPQNASAYDIKLAYRKLALQYHPDKASDKSDSRKLHDIFIKIQEAYEILRDDNKRRIYDAKVFNAVDHNLSSATMRTSEQQQVNQNQLYNQDIINKIKTAVMQRDEIRVANLCAEYKTLGFTEDQRLANQGTLNWLLRYCAEFKHNTIAMHLVGVGADVNQFGEILKFERYSIWTNSELVIVNCYFADMLAYWDNIQLLQMIGAEKFDFKIYMVTDSMPHNVENKLINIHGFILDSGEYRTGMFVKNKEYNKSLAVFNVDLAIRLQWLNTICYKLAQVGDRQTLEYIYNHYPFINRSSFWCNPDTQTANVTLGCARPTAKNTIQKFMRLLDNRDICVNHYLYQTQYFLDRNMSLHLHVMSNKSFRIEYLAHLSAIFLSHKELTAELMQALEFYYMHSIKIAASVFLGTLIGAPLLANGLTQLVVKDDKSAGNIAMIVFGSLFSVHFIMLVIMQVSLILARVLSCRNLEVNGSIDEVCYRLYQNLLIKDLLSKRHNQQQSHNGVNAPSMTYDYDIKRANTSQIKYEQTKVDAIAQINTGNNRANIAAEQRISLA